MSGLGSQVNKLASIPSQDLLRWVLSLGSGIVLAGALSFASWLILSGGPTRAAEEIEVVIPAGTAARVQAGAPPPSIPDKLTLIQGDTLVLRNQDSVEHRLGPYRVAAGDTLQAPLGQTGSQRFSCTFHPGGVIGLAVGGRSSPLAILWPTFLLGLPLGIVLAVVWTVFSRLTLDAQ